MPRYGYLNRWMMASPNYARPHSSGPLACGRVLASALKVGDGPVCHIYHDMKLVRRVAAAGKLAAALAPDATPTAGAPPRASRVSFAQAPASAQAGPSAASSAAPAVVQPESTAGPSQEAPGEPEVAELSPWDPPPRDAYGKVDDNRVFPQVCDAEHVYAKNVSCGVCFSRASQRMCRAVQFIVSGKLRLGPCQ